MARKMAHLTVPALGVVGSYVIIVILMMICLILITQRSLLKSVQNAGRTLQSKAKTGREHRKVQREEKKKVKEAKRQEHKVAGVSFDTTLEGRSPEIQELVVTEEKSLKRKQKRGQRRRNNRRHQRPRKKLGRRAYDYKSILL